jgi:hypothetical protein
MQFSSNPPDIFASRSRSNVVEFMAVGLSFGELFGGLGGDVPSNLSQSQAESSKNLNAA